LMKALAPLLTPGDTEITVTELFDYATCVKSHNLQGPSQITSDSVLKDLERATVLHWWGAFMNIQTSSSAQELARLTCGRLLNEILGFMKDSVDNKNKPVKFIAYAGHDTTIAPLLCAFGVYDRVWPTYGSTIVLELFSEKSNPSKHFVRLLYNDKVLKLPLDFTPSNSNTEDFSDFELFKKYTTQLIPTDYQKECSSKSKL